MSAEVPGQIGFTPEYTATYAFPNDTHVTFTAKIKDNVWFAMGKNTTSRVADCMPRCACRSRVVGFHMVRECAERKRPRLITARMSPFLAGVSADGTMDSSGSGSDIFVCSNSVVTRYWVTGKSMPASGVAVM